MRWTTKTQKINKNELKKEMIRFPVGLVIVLLVFPQNRDIVDISLAYTAITGYVHIVSKYPTTKILRLTIIQTKSILSSIPRISEDQLEYLITAIDKENLSFAGYRCMSFSEEKLTHIVVGTPSENEKKEIRYHVALGMINAVKAVWLEDCDRENKEVPVSQKHFPDLLPPKAVTGIIGICRGKSPMDASVLPTCQAKADMTFDTALSSKNDREKTVTTNPEGRTEEVAQSGRHGQPTLNDECKDQSKLRPASNTTTVQERKLSKIFKGQLFRFSSSFPEDQRPEIVDWVNQGGGTNTIVDGDSKQKVQFTIEPHGIMNKPFDVPHTTIISTHWIKFCLENGCMPDIGSHMIYSPLPCRVPFPGFQRFRICVSQYDAKDRLLPRNMCFVLGAKFSEKLTKRVTHLLCKFSSGPKYDAACNWGIEPVTSEWITECIWQDKIVPPNPFRPKTVTAQDQDAGLCTPSQYPTQATRMMSEDAPSQFPSQSQVLEKVSVPRNRKSSKRVRPTEGDKYTDLLPAKLNVVPTGKMYSTRSSTSNVTEQVSHDVPIFDPAYQMSLQSGTSELGSECVWQDPLLSMGTSGSEGGDAGIHKVGQYPTEPSQVVSVEVPPISPSHFHDPENLSSNGGYKTSTKRARLTDNDNHKVATRSTSVDVEEISDAAPDVASAIEDLLAQSNKMQDMSTPGRNGSDQSIFAPDCSIHVDPQPVFGISKHCLTRPEKQDDLGNASVAEVKQGTYDDISEIQTDSQVVMYEDDLSGRQG